jgi:hypothetical protein
MQRCVSLFLVAIGLCAAATTAFAQPEAPPPGPPAYDPSRPLPTILPPDPPYADPDPEADPSENTGSNPPPAEPPAEEAPGAASAPAASPPTYAAAPPPAYATESASSAPTSRLRFPDFTIQAEVLNVLPYGRLGFEFEFQLLNWLTVGTTPLFVVAREPLFLPPHIRQASNGIGPLAGASLSVGFWLSERAFEGTVLRLAFTNYGYRYEGLSLEDYEARNVSQGQILDRASHTERRLRLSVGHSFRFGHLMLSGGLGIEYELNQERRCLVPLGGYAPYVPSSDGCRSNEFRIQRRVSTPNGFDVYSLGGPLHPFALVLNLSVGVIITP